MTRIGTSEDLALYVTNTLNGVSRSFALAIPLLEPPLDQQIGLAYLLCRVCDNIEDTTQPFEWKQQRWHEFAIMLAKPSEAASRLSQWQECEWPGLTDDEQKMMGVDGGPLWQLLSYLPDETVQILQRWVSEMAQGMQYMLSPEAPLVDQDSIRVIKDKAAYDEYCYFVAGTVGHLCTEVAALHYGFSDQELAALSSLATDFGSGLQKTNIVKDFPTDAARGVSWLPASWLSEVDNTPLELAGAPTEWVKRVIEDVLVGLDAGIEYVLNLPESAEGYRRFCLAALLPAYETILCAAKSLPQLFTDHHNCKINRSAMMRCLKQVDEFAQHPAGLKGHQQALKKAIEHAMS